METTRWHVDSDAQRARMRTRARPSSYGGRGKALTTRWLLVMALCCCFQGWMPSVQAVSTGIAARVDAVPAQDGAFATIFYDYGEDSDAMLLAIRVLMRSIRDSQTKYRKLVIVPQDGLSPTSKQRFQQDDPSIEIVRADIPNIFRRNSVMDPRAQLLHMRNKLVLWDDPVLAKLQRIVYLDPENLVLNNFDEIFACAQFCAVDNGQSIVYSNSLLVISPESIAARNLYSDAIDSFMISGREYNYIGITQGFLPGLFQALEESPLFNVDQDETDDEFEKEAAKSVVRRLPFYYSINHMVFYERMNWDLYKCKDKNKSSKQIPGPLLSYKYSGATIKPWFWLPYVYFEVNWHWLDMRERLQEDHVGFFFSKLLSQSVLFVLSWFAYVAICLKLRSEPNGRMRRLSSWNLPGPTTTPALSMDLLNSNVVRKACQFSCNVLYAISSTPIFSSFVLVLVILWTSIYAMPPLMHPRFAAMLWACLLDSLVMTVLVVYHVAHMLRTTEWKREEAPSTLGLLVEALFEGSKRLPLLLLVQVLFLRYVGNTELFANPVLRPTVLILLLATLCMIQVRFIAQEMRRLARK